MREETGYKHLCSVVDIKPPTKRRRRSFFAAYMDGLDLLFTEDRRLTLAK